ncbi:MAG: GGDEF domain-containing protein [Paracoccaceae bacterium]
MRIAKATQKWVFVAVVTAVSLFSSVAITYLVSSSGLTRSALIPSVGVPMIVAPLMAYWAANMMLRINELNRHLEHLLRHDQMTGLLNRRAFLERLETPGQMPSGTVLFADIDRFKSINDTYGHAVGDQVIRDVATILKTKSEPDGLAARFGGEEFVTYYPDDCVQHAHIRAEAIRSAVENQSMVVDGKVLKYTLSIGLDVFDGKRSLDDVLQAADEALYNAKRSGRNQVMHYNFAAE